MLLGAFAGLVQRNLKRLWAYSSIANVGYALVGLSAGTHEGVQAMLVFMVLYMIDVTGFFACLTALSRDGRPMETMDDMAGLMRERPGMALAMTAFAVSGIGFPPFSGFWGKYFVFRAVIASGYSWVAVVGLVSSVVAAFYYLRLIKVMWFDPPIGAVDAAPADAKAVAYGAALFSLPVVLGALIEIEPLSRAAASAFALF
jgi:NADH-quinone oxidoreductase subunit N